MRVYQRIVPTAGTPVQLTTETVSFCDGFVAFAEKANGAANTGAVYIGVKGMNKTTMAGVVAKIATGGSFELTGNGDSHASILWVDADTNNDGVRVVIP